MTDGRRVLCQDSMKNELSYDNTDQRIFTTVDS